MVFTAQAAVPFVDDWFRSSILVYSKNGAVAFDRRQVRYLTQVKVQRESNKAFQPTKHAVSALWSRCRSTLPQGKHHIHCG